MEADESYVGGKAKNRAHRKPAPKKTVFTLVERDGEVRTQVVRDVSAKTLGPIINDNVNKASTLMTDEALVYEKIGEAYVAHGTVNHSANEYARAAVVPHQQRRELFLDPEARHQRRLSPRQRAAFAPILRRVRFSLQQPQDHRR